ncbi:hypothetical protein HK101_005333 [Irineochytrium annulatum]|nr:hypothetical protein HK101_005333 [Irineochytrium annulatum]
MSRRVLIMNLITIPIMIILALRSIPNPKPYFTAHVVFIAAAHVFTVNGILSLQKSPKPLSQTVPRHVYFQWSYLATFAFSFAFIYLNKEPKREGKPPGYRVHFKSLHAQFGLAAALLALFAGLYGWLSRAQWCCGGRWKGRVVPLRWMVWTRVWHRRLGYVAYAIWTVTVLLGLRTKWAKKELEEWERAFAAIVVVVNFIGILAGCELPKLKMRGRRQSSAF